MRIETAIRKQQKLFGELPPQTTLRLFIQHLKENCFCQDDYIRDLQTAYDNRKNAPLKVGYGE